MSTASVVTAAIQKAVRFNRRSVLAGGVVFAANAGLLGLHAVAGRVLAPFVGRSLETWAAVVAAFLVGVAAGSAFGGRAAAGRLSVWLLVGALSAVWMVLLPILLNASSLPITLPLRVRIAILAFLLCFPNGFVLGKLTLLATRIGGLSRVVVFLAVVGGLVGHVVASVVLLPAFTPNQIAVSTAAGLCVLAAVVSAVRLAPPVEVERRLHPALMPPESPQVPFRLDTATTWAATGTAAGVALGTFVVASSIVVPAAVALLVAVAVARWNRPTAGRVLCVAGGVAVGGLLVLVNSNAPVVEADDSAEPSALKAVYAAKDAHPESQRVVVPGERSTFPPRVRERPQRPRWKW